MLFGGTGRAGEAVQAQLILAALLLAILPVTILNVPRAIHRVAIELGTIPPGGEADAYHELVLTADGGLVLDGSRCADPVALRMGLDLMTLEPDPVLAIRPDPETRYETFLEALALIKRAQVERLHIVGEDGAVPVPGATAGANLPTGRRCEELGLPYRIH